MNQEINPFEVKEVHSQENHNYNDFLGNGNSLMQTKTQYHTAVKVVTPRNLVAVQKQFLAECELAGENFFYSWQVNTKKGKKTVEGKSFQLAKSLATHYGNCVVNCTIVNENKDFYFLQAEFIDLENGTTTVRPFIQRKDIGLGSKYDDGRALEMAIGIGISKAKRNIIFDGIPNWLAEEGMERAKQSALKKINQNLDQARAKAIESFDSAFGISEDVLANKIGKPASRWINSDILMLRTVYAQIKNGEVSLEEVFPSDEKKPEPKPENKKPEQKPEAPKDQPKVKVVKKSEQKEEPKKETKKVEDAKEVQEEKPQVDIDVVYEELLAVSTKQELTAFKKKYSDVISGDGSITVFELDELMQEISKKEQSLG